MVIEESPSPVEGQEKGETGHRLVLIVLSAKNEDRLREYAKNLHSFVKNQIINQKSELINLNDLAYTLQVGRQAMEERLAVTISSLQALTEKLDQYLQGKGKLKSFYQDNINSNKGKTKLLVDGASGKAFLQMAIGNREFDKLGQLWVSGVDIDWKLMVEERTPKRIALPTYPFARERYWIGTISEACQNQKSYKGIRVDRVNNSLDPGQVFGTSPSEKIKLKDQNLSLKNFPLEETTAITKKIGLKPLSEKQKQLYFEGRVLRNGEIQHTLSIPNTILIREHTVFGYHILPTDSLLEMVYQGAVRYFNAVELSIQNVFIMNPIVSFGNRLTQAYLTFKQKGESVCFEIKSFIEGDRAVFSKNIQGLISPHTYSLNVATGYQQMLAEVDNHPDYEFLDNKEHPLQVGEFFRSIRKVMCRGNEALSIIRLSDIAQQHRNQFLLHPSIFDSLLATIVHLIETMSEKEQSCSAATHSFIPVYIHRLDIIQPLKDDEYHAYVKVIQVEKEFTRVNAELIDGSNNIVLRLLGLDEKRIILNDIKNSVQNIIFGDDQNGRKKEISTGEFVQSNTDLACETELYLNNQGKCLTVLQKLLGETLLLKPALVDTNKKFLEQGLDSILGMEYIQKINGKYGLNLRGTVLYEHPTLIDLNIHILTEYPEVFQSTKQQKQVGERYQKDDHTNESVWESKNNTDLGREESASVGSCAPDLVERNLSDPATSSISKVLKTDMEKVQEDKKYAHSDGIRDIAIIGVSARFPKSQNLEELWHHLILGNYLITEVPKDHWDITPWRSLDSDVSSKIYCNQGGFIEDVDKFDPLFFKISPREAEVMDPQLRHLLEVVWETVEDAGYSQSIKGSKTGMFLGNCFNDYSHRLLEIKELGNQFSAIGNSNGSLSNRVSYVLDLNGPSLTLDTACSSSLVALHLACESLRKNETDMCLVGGVNLSLSPGKYLTFCDDRRAFQEGCDHAI